MLGCKTLLLAVLKPTGVTNTQTKCIPCNSAPLAIGEVVKCEHERSVHLFVDSLVNQDKQSFAFQCTDSSRFKKGICLSCRKNRCSGIGYNARRTRHKRNSKMYLKTRADMPFKGMPLERMWSDF